MSDIALLESPHHNKVLSEPYSSGKPHVSPERCIGCAMCTKICAHTAITVTERKASIDHELCVGCGRCIGVCPMDAVLPASDDQMKFWVKGYRNMLGQCYMGVHTSTLAS